MLTLTQAVSRVAARLNKNASDPTVYARIKNHINDTCLEKWHAYPWSFRYREYPLVTVAQVTTGTVTVSNGGTTVTASSGVFVSTHKGAWIRFTDDTLQAWYKVKTIVSTTQVVMEPTYQGTSGSGKSYQLCKTDYTLPSEVADVGRLKVSYNGVPLQIQHQFVTDSSFQPPLQVGPPNLATIFNQDQSLTTYTTGTITSTSGSPTLTGLSTLWLNNVQPGDEILITGDSNTYKVYSVDLDTQITLYNNVTTSLSGATYTISRQFGKVLRILPCPDYAYTSFVKGLRAYSPLINASDTNEFLVRFPYAVIEGGIWREAGASPDPREDSLYQRSELMWARAQGEDEQILSQVNYQPIFDPYQSRI